MQPIFNTEAFRQSAVDVDPKFLKSIDKCLVLAPHADDESLGCGGLIANLTDNKKHVKVVFTTDGSASHPNSKEYFREKLASLRQKEAIDALKILGVSPGDILFYNGKDSELPGQKEQGFSQFVGRLRNNIIEFQPDLILVPYELDPHRDHRATWQMLLEATIELPGHIPTIWEYPIWLYQNAASKDLPSLKVGELKIFDAKKYLIQKKKAIQTHLSQTTDLINDDPSGFRLLPNMIGNFTNGYEYYMQRAKLNLGTTLSQTYFDQIYQNNTDPWDFETSEYEKAKYHHTIQSLPEKRYHSALEIGCSIGVLTEMLAKHCDFLISIDISEKALQTAKKRLSTYNNVDFRVASIPDRFPQGHYDLIIMSEVGYYLSMADLKKSLKCIENQLTIGGTLLIVHWTHYVKDYPLTGDEVHELFLESNLAHLHGDRNKDYRLDVYLRK